MQEIRNTLEYITQGNQDALNVAMLLVGLQHELAAWDFEMLKNQSIRGADIHRLYVSCGKNVRKLHAVIMRETGVEMLKKVPGSSFYTGIKREGVLEDG